MRACSRSRISASRKHANFPFYFVAPPEFRTETSFIATTSRARPHPRKAAVTFTNRQVQRLRPASSRSVDEHIGKLLASEKPATPRVFSLPVR
jgi:hypothetical protein